jgi:pyridoxal phosphate phosphatase PHOSPHO2
MLLKKYGPLEKVAYIGDGKNDFCPATRLRYTDMLFMRQEKGLERFFNDEPEEKKRIKSSFVYWINPDTVWKAMPNYFSLQL